MIAAAMGLELGKAEGQLLEKAVELRDQLKISQLVMEYAADAIFLLDEEGRTVFANPAAEQMFGWSSSEFQGKKLHEVVHHQHPDGRPYPMEDCPLGRVFFSGTSLKFHEDVFFHKDGRPLPVACSNAAILRDEKVAGGVLIVRDITERKQAEEHRQLLVHELNHRVKNTLAIVQGIAQQSFKGDDMEASRKAFEGRLAALAMAHDLLTEDNWGKASLRQIIEKSVSPFCTAATRCRLEGPDTPLEPQTAVALSMAIHELATNATKYGALSTPEGVISVSWTANREEGRIALALTWKESGGPEVRKPARRGFGSRMIQHGLASELGGKVTMDFHPSGFLCSILCELPDKDAKQE